MQGEKLGRTLHEGRNWSRVSQANRSMGNQKGNEEWRIYETCRKKQSPLEGDLGGDFKYSLLQSPDLLSLGDGRGTIEDRGWNGIDIDFSNQLCYTKRVYYYTSKCGSIFGKSTRQRTYLPRS